MEDVKVSIIVAIYKSEPFLRKLLNSIINQTYKNLEIILVDDGSPDNSGKICDDYAKKDKRIKVIHKKNGGACEARNVGIENTTGEFVSIIDGDDWLEPDYIEYLLDTALKLDVEFVMTDHIFTTRDRHQIKSDNISKITGEEATKMIIYPYIPIGPWNKLYKTKLLKDNNITFSVPWSGEGLYFTSLVAQHCKYVGLGHKKIYNYRLNNAGSGLTNYKLEMATNALENIKNIKKNLIMKSDKIIAACDWHIWKNYNFVLKLIIATNSVKNESKLYNECIKYIRKNMFKVAKDVEFSIYAKFKIILVSLFPVLNAKITLYKEKRNLKKDIQNEIKNGGQND